jgi:preprotein translocase subunit SecF
MRILHQTNIDFMAKRRVMYVVSAVVILIGLISLFTKGIHYGIDFTGGTELVVQFSERPDVGQIRDMMNRIGFTGNEIKTFGEETRVLIRTQEQGEGTTIGDRIKNGLQTSFGNLRPRVLEEQKIGPKIGAELREDALYAILFSLVAIGLYIAFRFKFIYGVGALVALFHDVMVTLGVISLLDGLTPITNFEIDQNMIAALLTLVGLSVNDTVVIFDRLRENQKRYRTMGLGEIINKSLNETLSRTIITSGTIFIVTVILYLLGGEVNRGFGFTLTVGIQTGTYSSIYVASAVVLDYTMRKLPKTTVPQQSHRPRHETVKQGS